MSNKFRNVGAEFQPEDEIVIQSSSEFVIRQHIKRVKTQVRSVTFADDTGYTVIARKPMPDDWWRRYFKHLALRENKLLKHISEEA